MEKSNDLITHGIGLENPEVEVMDENWLPLQIIAFLRGGKKYCTQEREVVNTALKKYIVEHGSTLKDFEPYFQYYVGWIGNRVREILS